MPKSDCLKEIMTVKEVSETYGISRFTVIDAIKHGWIEARQSGGTWLLRRADAASRWGKKDADD